MARRSAVGSTSVLLAVLLLSFAGAHAQEDTPAAARKFKLNTVCAAAIERFCPTLADQVEESRNQVICLKPYRTDLSLPCRRAITAASTH